MNNKSFTNWAYMVLSIVFVIVALVGVIIGTTMDKPYDERTYLLVLSFMLMSLSFKFMDWAKEKGKG